MVFSSVILTDIFKGLYPYLFYVIKFNIITTQEVPFSLTLIFYRTVCIFLNLICGLHERGHLVKSSYFVQDCQCVLLDRWESTLKLQKSRFYSLWGKRTNNQWLTLKDYMHFMLTSLKGNIFFLKAFPHFLPISLFPFYSFHFFLFFLLFSSKCLVSYWI